MVTDNPFLSFIVDVSSDKERLYKILSEVYGRDMKTDVDDNDNDDDDDDDDDDDYDDDDNNEKDDENKDEDEDEIITEDVKPHKQGIAKVQTKQQRKQSPTLQALIDKYNPYDCRDRSTDISCMKDFFSRSVSEFDFSIVDDKGRRKWTVQAFKKLDEYLRMFQRVIMFTQRSDSEGLRGIFVDINSTTQQYLTRIYVSQPSLHNRIYTEHWRRIMRSDKSVMYSLIERKQANERHRLLHKFVINWSTIQQRLRVYSALIDKPIEQWSTLDPIRGVAFSSANGCPRKIEVLDSIFEFLTYSDYMERLKLVSKRTPLFRIGDQDSDITISDVDRALKFWGQDAILVQLGTAKDALQRQNRYLIDRNDPRWIDNAIIYKPTLMFPATDVVKMVAKVRQYYGMTMESRPNNRHARRKIGSLINSRMVRKVIKMDWPELYQHGEKHNISVGMHLFRKIYSVCIGSEELGFLDNIQRLTNRRIDKAVLQSACLRHSGSYNTVLSYDNVYVKFDLQPEVLVTPDRTMLLHLLEKMSNMQSQINSLTEMNNNLSRQFHDMRDEKTVQSETNEKLTQLYNEMIEHKKHMRGDEYIKFVLYTLKQNDIKITKNNVLKAKIGSSVYSTYKKNNKDSLLPENWTPPAMTIQNITKRKADIDDADNSDNKFNVPYGYKVVVPQNTKQVTNKKKQKIIDQRNLQKIKRDEETFGANNITMQCDDDKDVVKDHKFAPKVHRDLCPNNN